MPVFQISCSHIKKSHSYGSLLLQYPLLITFYLKMMQNLFSVLDKLPWDRLFWKVFFTFSWSHNFIYFMLTYGTSSLLTSFLFLKRVLDSPTNIFSIPRYNLWRSRDLESLRAVICFSKISFILSLNFLLQIFVLGLEDISK